MTDIFIQKFLISDAINTAQTLSVQIIPTLEACLTSFLSNINWDFNKIRVLLRGNDLTQNRDL